MPSYAGTVTTTAALLVPDNRARTALTIQNLGANAVFLSDNAPDPTLDGIRLAQFGTVTYLLRDGFDPRSSKYAVASGGTSAVSITEGVVPVVKPEMR